MNARHKRHLASKAKAKAEQKRFHVPSRLLPNLKQTRTAERDYQMKPTGSMASIGILHINTKSHTKPNEKLSIRGVDILHLI